jgi:regulator of protease activity HflC (stomatin/prohibitin superfamily)
MYFQIYFIVFIVIVILSFLRQINQYERGVLFTMGRFSRLLNPGWRIIVPIFQTMKKIDIRVKAVDVPDQNAITKDNVPVRVNAVIYYKVADAGKALIEVEDFKYAISQYAQTTMRNIVGEVTLDELLAQRDKIADRIREIVDIETGNWGLKVNNVELKDVSLPETMQRTIAKQAEAEREKRAVIITSEGELASSENLARAAHMLSATPGALHLRTLQSINDMSSDQSNTVVYMVPVEVLKAFEGFASHMAGESKNSNK